MTNFRTATSLALVGALLQVQVAYAVPDVALTPPSGNSPLQEEPAKGFDQLIEEAQDLMKERRPIDARAKLQKALLINPDDYQPHMLLGQYYLFDVGHFTLAYRYLLTAETLFSKKHGSDRNGTLDPLYSKEHAMLLYLLAEAELNLDRYQNSLESLERFGKLYWTDWLPGTKAWVLMKLKRLDEAVRVAQAGLLQGADSRRTYNILGILLSVQGNRELSLQAFAKAIAAESGLGGLGQVATPLNNAGEVYRELFQDNMAEAAWLRATKLPDGCDHILPSLNLASLYIDELRLFQAERVLQDFEACYAAQSVRSDTEHRALIALARGRIAMRMGDIDKAIDLLSHALNREQWFGKIGTNENDVRFAATITMAQALSAKASTLDDTVRDSFTASLQDVAQRQTFMAQSWWYYRQARKIGLEELDDLEDLFIRNTDTMVEYPTLGNFLATYPARSLNKRLERITKEDERTQADVFYLLYQGEKQFEEGNYSKAESTLKKVLGQLRPIDRLAIAETKTLLHIAEQRKRYFWQRLSAEEKAISQKEREDLFGSLPSHLRYYGLLLPASMQITGTDGSISTEARKIRGFLNNRFEILDSKANPALRYELRITEVGMKGDARQLQLSLIERNTGSVRASETASIAADGKGYEDGVNKFIASAFRHKVDPPGEPIPELELLKGVLE